MPKSIIKDGVFKLISKIVNSIFYPKNCENEKDFNQLKIALTLVTNEINKHHRFIIYGAIMILVNSILLLPEPFFFGLAIDKILPKKNLSLFLIAIISILLLKIITGLLNYNIKMIFFKINNKITIDIRQILLEKINTLPLRILESYNTGYLMSRIQDDPPRLSALFGDQIINLVKQFIIFIISITTLFFINWKLALISSAILPLFVYIVKYYGVKIKTQSNKVFENISLLSKSLQENIDMIPLCKLFGKKNYNVTRYIRLSFKTLKEFIKLRKLECTNVLMFSILGAILPLSMVAISGYEIMYKTFTIGMLITFLSILNNAVGALCELVSFYPELKKIQVALLRIGEILCLQTDIENIINLTDEINSITLKGISFSYDNKTYALKNISFKAKKGMKLGIVGHSGSGKSTLIKILSGLYDFDGEILINNSAITYKNRTLMLNKVSVVPQEPFIFNGSVYKNVVLGDANIKKSHVKSALVEANAWGFVNNLNYEMNTKLGERGNKLSIGQKQRIAIARALVKKSEILILDEATSNIDSISEREILNTIDAISENMIIFLISHKLENVKNCDNILVFNKGELVENGSHEELLALNGYYSSLLSQNLISSNS